MKTDQEQASIPIDRLGRPGLFGQLAIVPVFKGSNTDDESRLKDEAIRVFEISAVLGKHPSSDTNISVNIDCNSGGSYVIAAPNAEHTKLQTPEGDVLLYHNDERELSLVTYECEAASNEEARIRFLRALNPFLDHLSYVANMPVHVTQITCIDKKHFIQTVNYTVPHPKVTLNSCGQDIKNELLPIYALYREAKNSGSSFYKFLCYYKILEGVYLHLRPKVFKHAKRRHIELERRKELVPVGSEGVDEIPEKLQGKSIKKVFDNRFTPNFRNRVAHYITDSRHPLNVSDFRSLSEFRNELDLMEICVHVVIDTQEQYEAELQAKSV